MMENDDKPIGYMLSRRQVLKLLGLTGAAALAACAPGQVGTSQPAAATAAPTSAGAASTATAAPAAQATAAQAAAAIPACVAVPELTEGPYFVDEQINRSDIRSEPSTGALKDGTPLELTFNVSQISNGACAPLPRATVDVWHCDAQGVYSGVQDVGFDTSGQKWLRGYQVSDANGVARFTTIYPGWYSGRTVHIHFKIRTTGSDGQAYEFTSQLFFDEAVTAQVYAQAPYSSRGLPDTSNARDGIYQDETLLSPIAANGLYRAVQAVALDLSNTQIGAADGGGAGGPGGGVRP